MGVRGRSGGVSPEVSYPTLPPSTRDYILSPAPLQSRRTNPNLEHQRVPTSMQPRVGEGGSLGWKEAGTTSREAGQLDYCP